MKENIGQPRMLPTQSGDRMSQGLDEMLTGTRAFHRSTSAETMTAILNDDPPAISQIVQTTPPGLQRDWSIAAWRRILSSGFTLHPIRRLPWKRCRTRAAPHRSPSPRRENALKAKCLRGQSARRQFLRSQPSRTSSQAGKRESRLSTIPFRK